MTKHEFLEALEKLTGGLSAAERARLIEYYGEMIDDRMEEGLSEAEAVAALGAPEKVAEAFAPAPSAIGGGEAVGALSSLRVRVTGADVTVARAPLSNGAAAQLRFSDPAQFTWRMDGDTLEVAQPEASGARFSLGWLKQMISAPAQRVTITLSAALDGAFDYESVGGDLRVEGVEFGSALLRSGSGDMDLRETVCAEGFELHAQSGDVKLTNLSAATLYIGTASGDVEGTRLAAGEGAFVKTGSGDVSLSGLACGGELRLESASGDIEVRSLECGELTVVTASGDIELDRGRARAAAVRAASGDVRLEELETDPTLTVETASGDIDLTRCIARETAIKAVNGDVDVRLEPLPNGYDITANTVNGTIQLDDGVKAPAADALRPRIEIRTVQGDISARVIR